MSSLIRSEQSIDTNYSAAETRVGSLTSASSANNGIAQSINATSLSSALINNRVYSVGDVSLGTFVSGALAPSNMIVKTESQDSDSSCTDDDSTSGLDWKDNAKKLRINDGAVDYSMTSPSYSSTDSSNANSSGIHSGSRRSGGSRRNGRDDKLNPEDEERRRVRRERNKVAAAKCRQKRVNQTNDLLEETKVLEDEQSRLQEEIKTFQQQKEELEFLLEAHRVHCGAAIQPGVTTTAQSNTTLPIKSESPYEMQMASSQLVQAAGLRRPNMIPIAAPLTSSAMSELTNVPTSGFFVLGLQSMVNGHTGLTPITGLPASEIVSTPDGSRGTNSSFERSSDAKLTSL